MSWLFPSVIACLAGTLSLVLVYAYLFFQDRERSMGFWAASWSAYVVRLVFQVWLLLLPGSFALNIVQHFANLWSGLLLLMGTYVFIGKKIPGWWWVVALLGTLWIPVASLGELPFLTLNLPTFILLGAIFLFTGVSLLRSQTIYGMGKYIAGWGFILWGIHKVDYPLLASEEWYASAGYLLVMVLELLVALGMLLIYFERAKRELLKRESRLEAIFDNAAIGIGMVDEQGNCIRCNQRLADMLDYSEAELRQKHYSDLVHPDHLPLLARKFQEMVCGGLGEYNLDIQFRRKGGSSFWANLTFSPICGSSGEVEAVVGMLNDISEQKNAQESLQSKTHQQERLIETARQLTESLDVNQVLRNVGAGAKEILDAVGCIIYLLEPDRENLRPVVVLEPEYEEEILATPLKVEGSFTGKAVKERRSLIFNDVGGNDKGTQIPGTPVICEERVIVVPFIVDDQVVGAMCLNRIGIRFSIEDLALADTFAAYASTALKNAQDHDRLQCEVAERSQAESALRESQQRYRGLFEDSPISLWEQDFSEILAELDKLRQSGVTDMEAYLDAHPEEQFRLVSLPRVVDINQASLELFHAKSKAELLGNLQAILDKDYACTQKGSLLAIANRKKRYTFETTNRTLTGERIQVALSWHVAPGYEECYSKVLVSVMDLTERIQREREREAILALGTALRTARTRADILPVILSQVTDLLHAEGAVIGMRDPASGETLFELASGTATHLTGIRFAQGEGICGYVIENGQPYWNNDVRSDPLSVVIKPGMESRTLAAVPLIANDATIGVLMLTRESDISEADVRMLRAMAEMAANAIYRETLHERTLQYAGRLAAVSTIGRALAMSLDLPDIYARLVEGVHELLPDIATVLISSFNADRQTIHAAYAVQDGHPIDVSSLPPIPLAPTGQGTQSQVIHTRQPLIVDKLADRMHTKVVVGETSKQTQCALYVPMLAKGEVLGVFQVQSYTPNRFSQEDIELLTVVGNTAAIAMQNARLFDEAQRRIRNLNALHSIDKAITTNFRLDLILKVVLEQITSQLGVDAACILLYETASQSLVYAAECGFRTNGRLNKTLQVGTGYAGRVALERSTLTISDLGGSAGPVQETYSAKGQELQLTLVNPVAEGFVSYFGVPLIAKGQIKGVMELYHRQEAEPDQEWLNFLDTLARQTAIAIDNASLFADLQHSNIELVRAYDTTLEGWAKALELRDKETEGHSQRVTELSLLLASEMGIRADELVNVRRGALLHDIGKMGIPDSILLKPGPLTDDEWEVMRQHPTFAYNLLESIPFLHQAIDIPYCHHEKWDGSGYPRKLKGEEIPLAARIFALIDVWDALISDRPYRPAWPEEKVLNYLQEQAGKHFDPQVVEAFVRIRRGEGLGGFMD